MLSLANHFGGYTFVRLRGSRPFSMLFMNNDYIIMYEQFAQSLQSHFI